MNRKRIFSTLLVLALLVCMLPAAAYDWLSPLLNYLPFAPKETMVRILHDSYDF